MEDEQAVNGEDDYFEIRASKVENLREQGINPYPYEFNRVESATEARELFDPKSDEELQDEVSVCGRITARREHGGATFMDIMDESGTIQVYFSEKYLDDGDVYERCVDLWDIGDFIGIHGELFETGEGEISVVARTATILSKGLRPLPEKFHGLQDRELRYRKRYLDLLSNPEVRETFQTRSEFLLNLRQVLADRDFMEVETPMMQKIAGGAEAQPFETYHNALDLDLYLRIAPELFLKRLLVGGFERVYEINRNFRNEGISTQHNPEFTMLELYESYVDYHRIMELTEEVVSESIRRTVGSTTLEYGDRTIDWSTPWNRKPMLEILEEHTDLEWSLGMSQQDVFDRAHENGFKVEPCESTGAQLMEVFDEAVENNITDPTFVTEFPADISPLAKPHRDKPDHAERFELFCGGLEIGNAYSELNDPMLQRDNFERQAKDSSEIDEDFLEALEYGMPPAGGLGLGIDRIVMLITDSSSIRDVILFPLLRPNQG